MGLSPLCEPEGVEGRGTLLLPVLYIWGSTEGVIQRAESTAQDTNDIVPPSPLLSLEAQRKKQHSSESVV